MASWGEQRKDLAERIAAGLAGWFQLQGAQRLAKLSAEDTARLLVAQVVQAQGRYRVDVSKPATNWPTKCGKRIDIAILGSSEHAVGWYGAIEVKWVPEARSVDQVRNQIVEDAVRLASAETGNLNAKFLVVGGTKQGLDALFDKEHTQSVAAENQRVAFCRLLPRSKGKSETTRGTKVQEHFPNFESRVPPALKPVVTTSLKLHLLAARRASLGGSNVIGIVYVWQVNLGTGKACR